MSAVYPGGDQVPSAIGEFVGREPELERIGALLTGTARMISLVGPGGIGKTRLVTEAIRRFLPSGQRPVYWARLARLAPGADADTVAEEVVRAVQNADIAGRSTWNVLMEIFATDETGSGPVLILDNCEHALLGVGELIERLLRAVPQLTILATSREPIGWLDEHILIVPPLFPRQALEMFLRRAELTGRPIPREPEHLVVPEQICRRVDYIPLFIQLAAARLLYQPPAMLLRELTGDLNDKRMQWTHGQRVGMEQRHRGVRDVVAWSYSLCDATEQLMLDRMSVFAAGFEYDGDESRGNGAELDAIIAVCADDDTEPSSDHIARQNVEHLLERLVERSLVSVHFTRTTARYYLQESVRVFTSARLEQRREPGSDTAVLARKHRMYYREKVLAGHAAWSDPRGQGWLDWARAAWDNILIAIETSLSEPGEAVVGLEMVAELMALKVHFLKGANRALTQLAQHTVTITGQAEPPPTRLRIAAMAGIAWTALWQNRIAYATELLDECAEISVPDPEIRETWRDTTDVDIGLPAAMEFSWALELMLRLDPRALTVFRRACRKFVGEGDRDGAQWCELFETFMHALFSPAAQALDSARRHLDKAVQSHSRWALWWAELAWTLVLSLHGDTGEALAVGRTALARHFTAGDTWTASWVLGFRVIALTRVINERKPTDDPASARAAATQLAYLLGGLNSQRRSMGFNTSEQTVVNLYTEQALLAARKVLGPQDFELAEQQGRGLRPEFDELQRYVLGILDRDMVSSDLPEGTEPEPSRWPELSPAERDVAVLAAAGWTNSAIAARRGSSVRTVDAQVATIRQKLMISSRADIDQHIPQEVAEHVRRESRRRPRRSG